MRRVLFSLCLLAFSWEAWAHEGTPKNQKPTQAKRDLDRARKSLDAAKKDLAARGRYSCCTKPSCDLCARTNGSCACAKNVAAGRGSCGECYAGWKAGRGSVKGVSAKSVELLTADHQGCAMSASAAPGDGSPSPELKQAVDALLDAKKTLVAEKRYACCIRGGCGQCAHEGSCPCGSDLATGKKGVCGECLDGWKSGKGAFPGIDPGDVQLAAMEPMADGMGGPGGGASSGMYSSGTSQVPRAAPMDMLHRQAGAWSLMLSGEFFGVYTDQTGPRGRDKIFSTNWLMGSAGRKLGPGTLTVRTMLSLEPATITGERYPLLFGAGETAHGIPIINGQHPHDFFMELAAAYQLPLGERTALNFYGGPRGEPALGPPAYPHRISASEDPVAVISHHLQDSTHIATNVATAGITHRALTFEVSGFHGREPDEQRWGIEGGAINSISSRLTVTPTARWSGQFSIGRINQREATHPLRPTLRTTASITYVRPLSAGHWATSLIWGRDNDLSYTQLPPGQGPREVQFIEARPRPLHIVSVPTRIPRQIYNSFLAESTLRRGKNWVWGRAENTDKDSTLLYQEAPFVLLVDEQRYARVQAYTAGYERELPSLTSLLSTGIGAQVTLFRAPANLSPVYGSFPVGVQLFVKVRTGRRAN